MRDETLSSPNPRIAGGALLAAAAFVLAHATLIVAGKDVGWTGALAFAGANAAVWFVVAPALMAFGRAIGGGRGAFRWQLAIGAIAAPLFGWMQGLVALQVELRAPAPAPALALYYLDLNVAVLVLAAVTLDLYSRRAALAEHSRAFLALEARLFEVRHDLLTFQLQPHFLFNALTSVVELVREAPAEGARVLRDLRTLFLATTRRTSSAAVSLEDELQVVDAFIGVARARHADRLEFERHVEADALAASIPPLSLQPLVENAVQHALLGDDERRTIALEARVVAGRLRVTVTNSCASSDRRRRGLGIGLRNTRERLGHLFGKDQSLTLSLSPGFAVAVLDVPLLPLGTEVSPTRHAALLGDHPGEQSQFPDGEADPAGGAWRQRSVLALRIVGFWLIVWLFWVFQMHFYRVALGIVSERSPFVAGLADLMSAVSWMLMTPVALLLGRRYPVHGRRWPASLPMHVGAALASSAANIGFIATFYPLGTIPINNVLNQVVVNCAIYSLIVVWAHAERIGRWFDERRTATRRLEAELARARWDAMELRLQPELIAGELDRLAMLAERQPVEAEEGVLDMADALRRLLQAVPAPAPTRDLARVGES